MRARGSRPLLLAPLWPAVAAVAAMTAVLAAQLPPLLRATAGEPLLNALPGLHRTLAPALGGGPAALQRRVTLLAGGGALRLTAIAADGRVLADSDRTAAEVERMAGHGGRPEVAAALAGGAGVDARRSATTQRRYLYAARAFPAPAGGRYVLRLAQPLDERSAVRGRLLAAAAVALVAALAAAALVAAWLHRRLLRPLGGLVDGTAALAAEGGGPPLPLPAQDDLADLAAAVNLLTARLEAQRAAAAAERDHLAAILDAMADGVLVVDGDGRAVLANSAFRRLFAIGPGDVAGRRPLELTRRPELADLVAAALAGGAAPDGAVEIETEGEGGPRTLALAGAPLAAGGGAPGAVVVVRDATEAARVARMRSDFVANLSHELKTPLAAIRGYAETLRDGALAEPETARRFLARILDQTRRLELLLADLLTLSRLESAEAPRERRPVDLAAVVAHAAETVAPAARERRVEIAVDAAPGLPAVAGDPDHLERMAVNLLDNAVRYNRPGGRVAVTLALDPDAPAAAPAVLLAVADTGLGIPAAARERVFERFYRVDRGRARDDGGTGLGLAIVKHVAQAHGGTVEVESTPGQGSTFRVRLPAALGRE